MAQQAQPAREARLGRPIGATGAVRGAVLVLPGGEARSLRRGSALAAARARSLARALVCTEDAEPLACHVVHYRHRGWNGDAAHPAADAARAADEARRRYGNVPLCLAGHGLGARAALRAAGVEAVVSVVALGPWLPEAEEEPVRQLAGRHVLLAHGTDDRRTDPELSFRLAERLKKTNADVCRFEVHSERHEFRHRRAEVHALARDFVQGTLTGRPFSRPVADALAAPPPLGLRMPLASGFGQSLE